MLSLLTYWSCKRKPANVGEALLPLPTIHVDTFPVFLVSEIIDSVTTEGALTATFGTLYDSLTGTIEATALFQLSFEGTNLNFGSNPVLDSVILTLYLPTRYGDEFSPMRFQIFEIEQEWREDSLYHSRSALAYDGTPVGDTVLSFDSAFAPVVIRIRLDPRVGSKILSAPASALADPTAFKAFFKGLAVRAHPLSLASRGCIYSLIPTSSNTTLTLYYHQNGDTVPQPFTLRTYYQKDRYFTSIRRILSGNELVTRLDSTYLLFQAGALVRLRVHLPNLDPLRGKPVSKAILSIYSEPGLNTKASNLNPPPGVNVYFLKPDSNGNLLFSTSQFLTYSFYNETTLDYYIDLTAYVQQYLTGDFPYPDFVILPAALEYSFNRGVFGGPNHPQRRPLLCIYYAEIPE